MIRSQSRPRLQNSTLQLKLSRIEGVLALLALTLACVCITAQAQTFTVLHSFTGGGDGDAPVAGLSIDGAGNLYGTTSYGGRGPGVVYKLAERNSTWILSPLHSFTAGADGCDPANADLTIAPDGSLYGTTPLCGNELCSRGCGTVFHLRPSSSLPLTPTSPWTETILYYFREQQGPGASGRLAFDSAGNIFGTTKGGGVQGAGIAYELSPSNGGYTENTIYSFQSIVFPGGLIRDSLGNLYGVTQGTGLDYGEVFELSLSGSQWVATVLYAFQDGEDGEYPVGDLIADAQGNMYGTTSNGGTAGGGGTVFEMSPDGHGGWVHTTLAELPGGNPYQSPGPQDSLTMDSAGNLYGTAILNGAFHKGNVFKLTNNGGSWTYTSLYDFTGGSDGFLPFSNVVIDAQGNLYGTAAQGGAHGEGVVWKIVQ